MTKINYKQLNKELDEILAKLRSPDLDVDDAVLLYQRGMQITKELELYIKNATNKVSKIKAKFE